MPLSFVFVSVPVFLLCHAGYFVLFGFCFCFCLLLDTQNKTKQQKQQPPKNQSHCNRSKKQNPPQQILCCCSSSSSSPFSCCNNSLLCNPPILSFATKKILQKQTSKLTYFCSKNSLHTYLNDNKEKMKRDERDEIK